MSRKELSKNDICWSNLFEKYNILEEIDKKGVFVIRSADINKERESRLMAKFDHYVNLPAIFQQHKLSILPISRSEYIIGHFQTHQTIKSNFKTPIIDCPFPQEIETIDYTNIYSENAALLCAYHTGMIEDLMKEKAFFTVFGRMSTDKFEFNINSNIDEGKNYAILVEDSQCEIDAGFETKNYFLLLESKNYSIDDFLIRQIYYPYRLWSNKLEKKEKEIMPIIMTYSNDIFNFFIYKFEDKLNYNSLTLVAEKKYRITQNKIQGEDVNNVLQKIQLILEPDLPFPQANLFTRVVDLLSLLFTKDLTKDEIQENYQFDLRQVDYYTNAGRYLGLIDKLENKVTQEITFALTNEGRKIFQKKQKDKYLGLIGKILEHEVFYKVFELTIDKEEIPSQDKICEIMTQSSLRITGDTIKRRASTVRGWIDWIWAQIEN